MADRTFKRFSKGQKVEFIMSEDMEPFEGETIGGFRNGNVRIIPKKSDKGEVLTTKDVVSIRRDLVTEVKDK